ncbi:MAG: hypothetical protein ACK5OB_08885 [Pirellula sp.]
MRLVVFCMLAMAFLSTRIHALEVCFVNDTQQATTITVITGSDRIELQIDPRTHRFVSLPDSNDDRVVIAQSRSESKGESDSATTRVIGSQTLANRSDRRWRFCYVRPTADERMQMDLLGFACLDVVPMRWGSPAEVAEFRQVRDRLLKSLRETTESNPDVPSTMRPLLTFLPQAN